MLRRLLIHLAFLVVAGGNISAKAQDATKFEVVPIIGHAGSISTIEYSVDGRFALTGSWDSTLKLWEIATGRLLRTLEGHEPFGIRGYSYVTAISFSRDGQLAVSSGVDRTIRTWDLVHGQLLRTIPAHRGEPKAVSVSDDGQFIVSGSDVPDDDVGPFSRQLSARKSGFFDDPVLTLCGVLVRCQVAERAVWSALIVIDAPRFDLRLSVGD